MFNQFNKFNQINNLSQFQKSINIIRITYPYGHIYINITKSLTY